ncbi:zinc ribbon domain-containing protein [Actinopolyspora halophila]|uniref:zinc ribbon domain-containing protein n=1 Tax=Actinopolyspora halophila TaxID=1850 RepID=UPI00036CA954|nr:zinc ribbon domain-containing protein [Actinopolyspora halophila]
MQLRYRYRLSPAPGQRRALAQAFGNARVVFNDAVRARQTAHAAGEKFPAGSVLQKRLITDAKNTPERAWLANAQHSMLQQAIRDCDQAYKNFFDSLRGKRAGKWGTFRRLLSEKANRYGRELVIIDRWLPTSQTCSDCGRVDGAKPLSVRTWSCPCGATHDRDRNAARNILAAGRAERQNACGPDVRPHTGADGDEAGTQRSAAPAQQRITTPPPRR